MLKGIPPILGPDLLYILRAMGHGDEIAIVDANYPGDSAGPQLVRLDADLGPAARPLGLFAVDRQQHADGRRELRP